MPNLKARLKPWLRRSSTATSTSSQSSQSSVTDPLAQRRNTSKSSLLLPRTRRASSTAPVLEERDSSPQLPPLPTAQSRPTRDEQPPTPATSLETPTPFEKHNPTFVIEEPTPDLTPAFPERPSSAEPDEQTLASEEAHLPPPRLDLGARRQSLTHSTQSRFLETLLESEGPQQEAEERGDSEGVGAMVRANMLLQRRIWVRRPGQSATMVTIKEDDLVDDVRDMILRKYGNSLGRSFDSPDVTLRIVPRDSHHKHPKERILGPEESISRALDTAFPNGQTVDEALVIDVPHRRTPNHSPRIPMPGYYASDDLRPGENATDYFSSMQIPAKPSPNHPTSTAVNSSHVLPHHPASMAIISGQMPQVPSPGVRGARHSSSNSSLPSRPRYQRQNTTSPTVHGGVPKTQNHDILKSHTGNTPAPPPLPSPILPIEGQPHTDHTSTPPTARSTSPRPNKFTKKVKKPTDTTIKAASGLLDGTVPPINVLIVEDNIINLRLLEAFMKRLKVRWHTAMNGREAVQKWRQGGFHLVLMDIQLPVMNGLAATKEIRRLERVNHIGVFTNSAASTPIFSPSEEKEEENKEAAEGDDTLVNTGLFKSPVIIVALTASSLQSDRHEALAAGCNDFLTKPVNFVWLERKVREWGCMQALIDFDGWRKWKDFSQSTVPSSTAAAAKDGKEKGKDISSSPNNAANKNAVGAAAGGANTASKGGDVAGSVGGEKKTPASGTTRRERRSSLGTGTALATTTTTETTRSGSGSESSGTIAAGA
ncbi:MAG: hypothetical protein Q9190_004346 [Brigantiaea leucoxantha]